MIRPVKEWLKAHWPRLRLRFILLSVLVFAAGLPGVGAVFLRVYENTLVRQTEAELIAQGAAVSAAAAAEWPGAVPVSADRRMLNGYYRPELLRIDLRTSPVLPERPLRKAEARPSQNAVRVGLAIAPIIAGTSRTTLASIRLLDRYGVVASASGDRGVRLADLREVRAALTGNSLTVLRKNGDYRQRYFLELLSRAAGIRVHHARPVIVNGRVVGVLLLSRSPRGLFVGLYQDRGKIALGVVLIFLVLFGIAAVLSRAIARPIEALGAATREVAQGGGHVPAPPATAAIEIQALYADFADMAAAIERRSRYLRDFAHAVSHEFKTPLAGITGAIELLQDHHDDMADEERRRFLANASADAQRLALLVTRLLDLARADMARPDTEAAVNPWPVLHRIADGHSGTQFAVRLDELTDLPPVAVPEGALAAVVTSLIENSRQAGARSVTIAARIEAEAIILDVADDGPGIAPGDRARIFEPFFTGRRESGGTGLGLPIARSLIEAARGWIIIADSAQGARFEIGLPRATA